MRLNTLYSPDIYKKIMDAELARKNDIYRYELMKPFDGKWKCYHIPLKAEYEGGYDIIMACSMMGLLPPTDIDSTSAGAIDLLSDKALWDNSRSSIEKSLARFEKAGIELKEND